MAATLLIAVGTGVAATLAGLSMALGAFIAGLMLAETEFRRAIEAIIEPFKGLLLGAFFLLVGLGIDLHGLTQQPIRILAAVAGLIVLKGLIIYGLARLFRVNRGPAIESAMLLGPCGEFAFVILGQASALGILDGGSNREALLIVTLTMLAIPLFARLGARLNLRLKQRAATSLVNDTPLPDDH
jgi:CPA2 family monovalent cation:H+ antiporter-2